MATDYSDHHHHHHDTGDSFRYYPVYHNHQDTHTTQTQTQTQTQTASTRTAQTTQSTTATFRCGEASSSSSSPSPLSSSSPSVAPRSSASTSLYYKYSCCEEERMSIQALNNKACALMAKGCFSKANHLLEVALWKHKEIMTARLFGGSYCHYDHYNADASSSSNSNSNCNCNCNCNCHDATTCTDETTMDLYTFDDLMEDLFTDAGVDNLMMAVDHDESDSLGTSETHSPTAAAAAAAATSSTRTTATTTTTTPPSTMTRNSLVRTIPYAGQEESRTTTPRTWMYHQVYSLPIVMEKSEWRKASMDDRSFVLIFNSALSNHLWGMQKFSAMSMISSSTMSSPSWWYHGANIPSESGSGSGSGTNDPWELFHIAKTLYKLALEYIKHDIKGVDKICIPAVFHNLSHICKTQEGETTSQEGLYYDSVLLKAVYWWIDSSSAEASPISSSSSRSVSASASASASHSAASQNNNNNNNNMHGSNSNRTNHSGGYGHAEIIDAFLENSFHLVGTPPTDVPAAAA